MRKPGTCPSLLFLLWLISAQTGIRCSKPSWEAYTKQTTVKPSDSVVVIFVDFRDSSESTLYIFDEKGGYHDMVGGKDYEHQTVIIPWKKDFKFIHIGKGCRVGLSKSSATSL